MKRLILCMLCFFLAYCSNAQNPSDIIFIGTSNDMPSTIQGNLDGFYKLVPQQQKWTKDNSFSYYLGFGNKNFNLKFRHVNYKEEYSQKADLQIVDMPTNQLSDLGQVIDINEFIATKSQKEVLDWALNNLNNKIWVIDRRDFYKSTSELSDPDMMKVVQCEIWIQDLPYLQEGNLAN